jgi:hypothetical protein
MPADGRAGRALEAVSGSSPASASGPGPAHGAGDDDTTGSSPDGSDRGAIHLSRVAGGHRDLMCRYKVFIDGV